ncbi:ECF transporter S component [Irregularibacter muris]|uniref:Riboflavin transporter n=1 Tax=Irregularibacter muris TaxID=1796619 RepID=A0AAE3HI56_9FIRM|nr:ECF transporter S component [Irregularibacter muris]MCR1899374.1 ECF transporter S component [Irregularibacter muris]
MKQVTLSNQSSSLSATNRMVKISVLSVIAFIIMLFEMVVPFFPAFLKMDFSDVPALLGSFALGPVAGVIIQLLKNILHIVLRGTSTAGVGELSNFIVGGMFVFTAGSIYKMNKNKKYAMIGMIVATIVMSAVGILTNLYLVVPFYSKAMGIPLDAIVNMGTVANARIIDLKTLIIYGVTPFNIIKGVAISIVVTLIYKKLTPILHK